MRSSGEATISDECNVFAETASHDGAGWREHLSHAGTSLGPLIADDDDISLLDAAGQDAFKGLFFRFKDAGLSFEEEAFLTGDLGDGSLGSKVSLEDDEMALGFDRIGKRTDDLLILRIRFEGGKILFERLAGDGHAIAMQESRFKQHLHHRHDAPDLDQLRHEVLAAWLEVGKDRDTFADASEILKGQLHPCGVGDGKQMENGIGGTSECDDNGDRILKCLLGHDVEGADSFLEEIQDSSSGVAAILHLV